MEVSWNIHKPVLCNTFGRLTLKDIASSSLVCKVWRLIADSDPLWQTKCQQDLKISEKDPYLNWKNWYRLNSKKINYFSHYHLLARDIILVWEESFYLDDISNYQQRGMQKQHIIDSQHTQKITCTHAEGDEAITKFFTGSQDKSIKIWTRNLDSRKFECIQTLANHKGMITALTSNTKFLFSVSSDRNVHVWKMDENQTYNLAQTLLGHKDSITAIQCFEDGDLPYLFTSSLDKTIKIWKNIEGTFELFQTLETPHVVNCIELIEFSTGEYQLLSGVDDGKILIWHEQHNKLWSCAYIINAHISPISTICFHPQLKTICSAGGKEAKSWIFAENREEWVSTDTIQKTEDTICNIKLGHYSPISKQSEIYVLTEGDLLISWLNEAGVIFTDKSIEFPHEDML
jgi:WD40 repeat protein